MTELADRANRIEQALALAADEKPAYGMLYPFLEALFLLQADVAQSLVIALPPMDPMTAHTRWDAGSPLLQRWEFPVDLDAAESILKRLETSIPDDNTLLKKAHEELARAIRDRAGQREELWRSFLHHDWEPWEEWVATEQVDPASLIFLARSCLRPSVERVAESLIKQFPIPEDWLRGYCPVCGSLPSLLLLEGEGQRKSFCSWCASQWPTLRFQCPHCDNRDHASLGYLYVEAEPQYHIQYCRLCQTYFKQIDVRERLYPPYLPLEELTTLHLDLLAQRAGWKQPPSVSSVVYGDGA
jgi:FdhE protein